MSNYKIPDSVNVRINNLNNQMLILGGIYPCMQYLHAHYSRINRDGNNISLSTNVVFFHTYMPPKFMLAQPRGNIIFSNNLFIYEVIWVCA